MQQRTFGAIDPGFLPQKYDHLTDGVLFVRLSEAKIREASFLDDRILAPGIEGFWTPFNDVGAPKQVKPIHFIFHAGHTGSTLLSRLLATAGVVPLREPLPLRSLAELHDTLATPHSIFSNDEFTDRLDLFLRLWARGYEATHSVLLKATSTAGRMAPVLLDARPAANAIYVSLSREPYLATLLAGANAMVDLRGHAQERNRRLERLLGEAPLILHRASAGELAAMAWLAETLAQQAAIRHAPSRVLALDFEALLDDLDTTLAAAANHLGLPVPPPATVAAIMNRYSKGPEHAYSPALRTQLLAQARHEQAEELRKGLDWLERIAARHAAVAGALASA